ncbi:DinB family protein [Candidatus Dojkabacteria bacterium]|uniref:DinB family protein n=1 Tax=Candidatus Dojkabacteria bacterium TaxID=2099670 RepID=A0A955L493_9BACT|nr:DinB family protein [Candidatus Dojkabacteria bacterium]
MKREIEQKVEDFKKVRMELLEFVQDLTPAQKNSKAFDKWTLKEVLAHMSGWDLQNVEDLDEMLQSRETPWIPNFDEYNNHSVAEAEDLSFSEVYQNFLESGAVFIETYKNLPAEVVAIHLWHGHDHTPISLLEENISHYTNHLAEMKKVFASSIN